ncbi:adenylosuccinate lyase [Candidatus Nomurabacteria bacterium]|nr:adenylosuccinate lyase [Candidatus Nomurabacteria bacterium]
MTTDAISPLDGRYFEKTRALAPYFSEEALMKYRVLVECEFFIHLSNSKITDLRKLNASEVKKVRSLYENFSSESYNKIKKIEKVTNHDVKAVEYFIKENFKKTSLKNTLEWVHFGLTSEDVNNCAYGLMLSLSLNNVIEPELLKIENALGLLARKNKSLAMLARTHGQGASPTTLGKEFAVFLSRLKRQHKTLKQNKILVKLNGATGNYNAFLVAYPKANWIKFSNTFVKHLSKISSGNLEVNLITTQIEPHDTYAELFDNLKRVNTILLDLNQDLWRYVSDNYLTQKQKEGEVGSSTMPHKINPIDFENSEGNLGIANSLFEFFSRKLPISRLQRDLSDSTVERSFGTAFGHSYIAYTSLLKGLSKISVNKEKIKEDLWSHQEVIAEAIQTILRRENYPVPYEALKELTRGKVVDKASFQNFINALKVSEKVKKELGKITPENYIGSASVLSVL